MALLFMDSFDHYATADITEKWTLISTYSSSIVAGGRNGTNCYKEDSGGYVGSTCLGGVDEAIIGAAVKHSSFNGGSPMFVFGSGTTWECGLLTNADGTIQPFRANNVAMSPDNNLFMTAIGSASVVALQTGVWAYVEVRMRCHDTLGTCIVRVNGIEVLNLSGLDTLLTSGSLTRIALGGKYQVTYYDDLVVMDLNGSVNNSFLGDVTVTALYPNGAGTTSGWTPSAGSNHQNVDETPANDDTDYNATATLNAKDTYAMQDCAAGADIRAVQILAAVRKGAEGPGQIKIVTRSNSTDYDGAAQGIGGTSYSYVREIRETDPATAAAWSESGFNAAEFGIKKTA